MMIFWVILTLALVLSIAMIVMVLLQPSKGGGITAAFGGIGGTLGSTFGQRRTLEALGKGTTYTAIIIAVLCLMANLFFVPRAGESSGAQTPVTSGANAPIVQPAPGEGGLNVDNQSASPATGESSAEGPSRSGGEQSGTGAVSAPDGGNTDEE